MKEYRVVSSDGDVYGPVDNKEEAKELLDYHTKYGSDLYHLETRKVTEWKKLERR